MLSLAGLSGCADSYALSPAMRIKSASETAAPPPELSYESPSPTPADKPAGPTAGLAADVDTSKPASARILIYTAQLQVSTTDIDAALTAARRLCDEVGGYMDALMPDSIRIRVPAARFDEVLERVKTLGTVRSRNIQAQDVTDEYVDLQLRLRNAEALRDRLAAILEKAQTVKETLEVERELGRIREEIERIKGRLATLEKQVAFSTITISFVRPAEMQIERQAPPPPFPWLDDLTVERVLRLVQ